MFYIRLAIMIVTIIAILIGIGVWYSYDNHL